MSAEPPAGERPARRSPAALAVPAVLGLVLGVLLGWLVLAPHHPGDDSPDAGFARDMYEHHAQAVEMSLLVLGTTEDEAVHQLAWDIATSQANQMGQMEGWIRTWGLSMARSGPRMAWMPQEHDHAGPAPSGARMPGMATGEEMQHLREATGRDADVLFLQLMVTHHLAGVDMAGTATDLVEQPEVLRLARAMAVAQDGEITLMADMLAERGSAPREDLDQLAPPAGQDGPTHGDHG